MHTVGQFKLLSQRILRPVIPVGLFYYWLQIVHPLFKPLHMGSHKALFWDHYYFYYISMIFSMLYLNQILK